MHKQTHQHWQPRQFKQIKHKDM